VSVATSIHRGSCGKGAPKLLLPLLLLLLLLLTLLRPGTAVAGMLAAPPMGNLLRNPLLLLLLTAARRMELCGKLPADAVAAGMRPASDASRDWRLAAASAWRLHHLLKAACSMT
jgi:hypothetical protein